MSNKPPQPNALLLTELTTLRAILHYALPSVQASLLIRQTSHLYSDKQQQQ